MSKILVVVLIFVFLFFDPFSGFGQNQRNNSYGVESSLSYNYLEDLKFHFQFCYSLKKHEPFIGIEFPVNSNPTSNYGFNIGYRFYPNQYRQTFDFYFHYLLQANSRKLYSNSTINGFSLHNSAGYGFKVQLGNSIFLNHYIAVGIENSWFGENGSFTDLSLMASLGIGFKIKSKRNSK